jgi:DNA-binding NarL/FixJ family response regulator
MRSATPWSAGVADRAFQYRFQCSQPFNIAVLDFQGKGKMTVLIVEDNASVRRLLRRAIDNVATQIWECHDGADALSFYDNHRPDVVLMDIRMPRIDGLVATRQIRELYPSARIVIVTDCDDEDLRLAAYEAGACGYVLKQNLVDLAPLIDTMMLRANPESPNSRVE